MYPPEPLAYGPAVSPITTLLYLSSNTAYALASIFSRSTRRVMKMKTLKHDSESMSR